MNMPCTINLTKFIPATMQMIRSHSIASGADFVKLNWAHPQFQPERYQVNYVCTRKPACTPTNDANQYITTKTTNLSSDTNSVTIPNLRPSTICMLFLLAVYNPASIDAGIAITGGTLDENEREISPGWRCFMMTLIIVCISRYMCTRMSVFVCARVRCSHIVTIYSITLYYILQVYRLYSLGYSHILVNSCIYNKQEAY